MLYYSSFLFGLVGVISHATWMGPAFTLLMGVSILNHARYYEPTFSEREIVSVFDRLLAHTIAARTISDAISTKWTPKTAPYLAFYYACLAWDISIYHIARRLLKEGYSNTIHLTVHVATSAGVIALHYARS